MKNQKTLWALVLGGSKGLGLATAHKLASQGYNLILVHRDRALYLPEFLGEKHKMEALGVQVHSFNKDAVRSIHRNEMVQKIKLLIGTSKIDVFVHSIAKGNLKPIFKPGSPELNKEDLLVTLNAMAISFYDWTQTLVSERVFSNQARIIAFTSEGSSKIIPGYAAVANAKASLETLMKNMAVSYAPLGLRINCIQAGVTDTESFRKIPNNLEILEESKKRNPYNRLTTPQNVADVVALLCMKEADWINGTIIKVDGGESLI
ncbi:SDR family oxidoreductase [Eudoraea sp.]|uniref:SDR family oxidoreductase n=1 Tax=Eudoraea sp. TaxID=1979955 RepID=UPI003C7484A7